MTIARAWLFVGLFAMAACAARNPASPAPSAAPPQPAGSNAHWTPGPGAAMVPSEEGATVPISASNPTWGSRLALVTIVEYGDFQCPYTAKAAATLEQVRSAYGPEKLRIVWKSDPLPFHKEAKPASEAAAGVFAMAGSDAFWKFHALAFANQSALDRGNYEKWAEKAGVQDLGAFKAGLDDHRWADSVEKDVNEATGAGVEGTPSFFVNGAFVSGAQSFGDFKKVIDEELGKAEQRVANGTALAAIYKEQANDNRKNAPKRKDDDEADEKEDTTTVYKVPVDKSPVLGSPTALVTIVEFGDFQCPFCARVQVTLKKLRDKYGDKIRIVWKNEPLPFHPAAEPAAEAAIEARVEKGEKGFWKAHEALYADSVNLTKGSDADVDRIVAAATKSGADAQHVRQAIATHAHKKVIDEDGDLAEDFQANGTPHFFVNGRRIVGAQPPEVFEAIIDEEIQKAQQLLAKKGAAVDLYAALIKDGKGPPPLEAKNVPRALPAADPSKGGPAAKVTIHEWADFQCSFCRRAEATVKQIARDYGGRVRLVWHDLPLSFHHDATLAAEAGREALAQKGPDAFWAIHDKMLASEDPLSRDVLDGYAADLHLNMQRWKAALDLSAHASEIDASQKAAYDTDITGTPTFLVVSLGSTKGYLLVGALPYARFRRAIEQALSEAK